MSKLADFRVAVLATDGFEESELMEPVKACATWLPPQAFPARLGSPSVTSPAALTNAGAVVHPAPHAGGPH